MVLGGPGVAGWAKIVTKGRKMGFAPASRSATAGGIILSIVAVVCLLPTAGADETDLPPLPGLLERDADHVDVPPRRPTIATAFANGCEPPNPVVDWARLPSTLRTVPLRAMIGQLLVISYSGSAPSARGVEIARQALRRSEIGGVLTFRYNIEAADDTRAINALFENAHPVLPAIVAIDQEGGAVTRVKPTEGAPKTPAAADIAEGSVADALAAYEAMARNLADLGFTLNFGPVVDLEVNADNPVIARYGRSYGASPVTVERYARAFIEAHHAYGVATSLKHFPGHGSSTADSHEGAIDLTSTWSRRELEPFAVLIGEGLADTVMIGHLELDGVTGPGHLPASLSPVTIATILRNTLCFDGLVISDDLAMDAIEHRWGTPEAVRLMVDAGGDIALLSLPPRKGMALVTEITDYLEEAAEASPELAQKIRDAYARVVNFKLDLPVSRGPQRRIAVGERTGKARGKMAVN